MMRKISKAFSLGCVAAAIHIASTQGWASSSASGGAPLPIDDPPECNIREVGHRAHQDESDSYCTAIHDGTRMH